MDPRTGMPRVGMVGGGQLARMTHQSGVALGQSLHVLSIGADESAALVTPNVQIGSHLDLDALSTFAQGCDVVTFDHEHVPLAHIRALVEAGHTVHPGADALQYAQDKALMRRKLAELGLPVPEFEVIPAGSDLSAAVAGFGAAHGWPVVVKTARGGYDGRGVWVLEDLGGADALATELGATGLTGTESTGTESTGTESTETGLIAAGLAATGLISTVVLEPFVAMRRELAAVVARSPFGQAAAWPVVQTVQQDGICVEVIAPAPDLDPDLAAQACELALRIAGELGVVGVLAVELFELAGQDAAGTGRLLVNELAMRPHNSGHWTMDGSMTSQFEQHLRAVLDYPLGRTDAVAPFTVMGNVLGGTDTGPGSEIGMDERVHHLAARFPQVKIHLYGKAFRPGRKLGHVNVTGADPAVLRRVATLSAAWLGTGRWADGYEIHSGITTAGSTEREMTGSSP